MSNPVIDCLLNHRSIRKYKPQPIEPEKLDLILRAGTRAATAGNLQLYSFIVIDNDDKKEALKKQMYDIFDAPIAVVALIDQHRVKRWFEASGVESDKICNHKASHFFIAWWDVMIALQNMVVAAESIGLGTCYNGNVLRHDLSWILDLPEHVFAAGMVFMGYPDESPDLSMRLPMEAVVHRNSYKSPTDDQINEFYEERNRIWDNLTDQLKAKLKKKGVNNIAQGVVRRKYTDEIENEKGLPITLSVGKDSRVLVDNIKKAGFDLGWE